MVPLCILHYNMQRSIVSIKSVVETAEGPQNLVFNFFWHKTFHQFQKSIIIKGHQSLHTLTLFVLEFIIMYSML